MIANGALFTFIVAYLSAYQLARYENFTMDLGLSEDAAYDLAQRTTVAFATCAANDEIDTSIYTGEYLASLAMSQLSDAALSQGDQDVR